MNIVFLPSEMFSLICKDFDLYNLLNLEGTCIEIFQKFKNELWELYTNQILRKHKVTHINNNLDYWKLNYINILRSKIFATSVEDGIQVNNYFLMPSANKFWLKEFSPELKNHVCCLYNSMYYLTIYVYMNITFSGIYKFVVCIYIDNSFPLRELALIVKDRIRQVTLSEELIILDNLEKNKWIYITSDYFEIFKRNSKIKLEIKNLERILMAYWM